MVDGDEGAGADVTPLMPASVGVDPIEQLQVYATKTREYMLALTALICLTTLSLFFLALTLRDEFASTRNSIVFAAALLSFAAVFSYLLQQNATVALLTMMRASLGHQSMAGDMANLHRAQFHHNRVMQARMQAGMMSDTMTRLQPQVATR